jgi:hypothetical protein
MTSAVTTEHGDVTPLPRPSARTNLRLLRRLLRDPRPALDELTATVGPVAGLGLGPMRLAVVGDPVALGELFSTPTESFRWGHRFNTLGFVVGDESMIVSDGPDHRRRRASVQAAFGRRRLDGWIPIVVEEADRTVDELTARPDPTTATPVDLAPVVRTAVLRIAIRAFFGDRLVDRADELGDRFRRAQDYLESPALRQLPHRLPGTSRARVRDDRRALDAIIDTEVAACRRSPSGDPLDVLESLVVDGTLTDDEIRDQVVTLIGAGYDTTAASLAWALWCTTTTDGLWGRLRQEADEVLGPPGSPVPPDHDVLTRLELTDRTVREVLRLHPAGSFAPREAVVDVEIGGHRIRRGTLVLWSPYLAGRDPRTWPDPLRFDPDRFVDLTDEQRARAEAAWVPFGRGPRRCIGFALAQMELVLLLARLAQRLDLIPTSASVPPAIGMVVNRPLGGVPMGVTAR